MSAINENICKAINIIAKRIVDKAKYDKTITGTIMEVVVNGQQIYKVQSGNALYTAQAIGESTYKTGDIVYMLIPQNDTKQTKFILGKQ